MLPVEDQVSLIPEYFGLRGGEVHLNDAAAICHLELDASMLPPAYPTATYVGFKQQIDEASHVMAMSFYKRMRVTKPCIWNADEVHVWRVVEHLDWLRIRMRQILDEET